MDSSVNAHSFLKKISGSDAGKIYPLYSTLSTIGRAAHNTLCMSEPFLSRKHCSIRHEDPNWIITDYGGLNGTYLNGQRMESSGYRVLKDKTIVFLGDPEESTCGFIFLTSLPASAQQAESAENGASSSTSVPAPNLDSSQPSSSDPSLPSLSQELGNTSDPPPDQSDDVSSTRSGADNVTDAPILMDPVPPNHRERLERKRRLIQGRREGLSSLNDRMLPSYDANASRRNSDPDSRAKVRRKQMLIQRRSNTLSPLNDRMLPIFYDASVNNHTSAFRNNTDLVYPFLPSLGSFRPYPGQSTSRNPQVITIDDAPEVTVSRASTSEQAQVITIDVAPEETVPAASTSEQADASLSVQITSEAGSSRGTSSNPPEFDVLDMLVDSVDSDHSDSDCSISSLDSLGTRIRKQKLKSRRSLGGNKSLGSSPTKGASSDDEVKVVEPRSQAKIKSELEPENFQDSESLIQNIEDELRDSVTKLGNEDWISASKSKESITLQYLEKRVKLMQKEVRLTIDKYKGAVDQIKEQEALIKELTEKQGVSREQLTEDLESELSCNICTEILIKPVILECGHIFCQYCIGVWKKKKKQCPNCREPIKTEETEVRVLDSYLNKVIERLEPMHRMKRNELIESRKTETVKLKKSNRKRTPSLRVTAALGSARTDMFPELRVYRRLQNVGGVRTSNVSVTLRHLHAQRGENPLLRRLVDRIERGQLPVTPP